MSNETEGAKPQKKARKPAGEAIGAVLDAALADDEAPAEALIEVDLRADQLERLLARVSEIPPMGEAWELPVDGAMKDIEPGQWMYGFKDHRTGLPINCPVRPLGISREGCWFLSPLGAVYLMKPSAGKGDWDHLFAPCNDYLYWGWPQKKPILGDAPRGQEKPVIGWDVENYKAELVRTDLFRAAGLKGQFDAVQKVRGRGAWRAKDGGIIYHAGDQVLINNVWVEPGEIDGFIYTSKSPIGRPADSPSSVALSDDCSWSAEAILNVLKTWNWERPEIDPYLVFGFLCSAMVCGALKARPPVWISGAAGSGKSELFKFIGLIMREALVEGEGVTAASTYQTLKEDAIAVLLDEKENGEDRRRLQAILELVTISFTGGKIARGGQDGVPVNYTLRSSFLLSGIIQASMNSALESRIISLMIHPIDATKATGAVFDAKTIKRASADILGRLIKGWDRYEPTFSAVREYLGTLGLSGREQDSFGTIITFAHMAMFDLEIADMGNAALPMDLKWWGDKLPRSKRETSWQALYSHILEAPIERHKHTKTPNIEAILAEYMNDTGADLEPLKACNAKLFDLGLFVEESWDSGVKVVELFVPNRHVGFAAFMRPTVWGGGTGESGAWGGVLKQFPATVARGPVTVKRKPLTKATVGYFINIEAAGKGFE